MSSALRVNRTSRFLLLLAALFALCTSGVQAGKIMLTKQNKLATLFSDPSFRGNYFALDGIYRSCYNVLNDAKIGSLTLESGTVYCEIWGVEDCGEADGYGKAKSREVVGQIATLKWDGIDESKGGKDEIKRDTIEEDGIKSLRCFDKPVKSTSRQ